MSLFTVASVFMQMTPRCVRQQTDVIDRPHGRFQRLSGCMRIRVGVQSRVGGAAVYCPKVLKKSPLFLLAAVWFGLFRVQIFWCVMKKASVAEVTVSKQQRVLRMRCFFSSSFLKLKLKSSFSMVNAWLCTEVALHQQVSYRTRHKHHATTPAVP